MSRTRYTDEDKARLLGEFDATKEEVMFKAKPGTTVVKVRPLKRLKAIRLDPKLANACCGRSIIAMAAADWPAVRDTLQTMFERGNLGDSRLHRMLQAARDNYLKVTHHIADDREFATDNRGSYEVR